MSLKNIPFQPVQFGDFDASVYQVPVRVGDTISFQVDADLCAGSEQLLVNNEFEDGLVGWGSNSSSVNEGVLSLFGFEAFAFQQIEEGENGDSFFLEINVLQVSGVLNVGWSGQTVQITEPGTYQFVITKANGPFRIQQEFGVSQISYVKLYEYFDVTDFELDILDTDGTVVDTIPDGNFNISQGRLFVNFPWPDIANGVYRMRLTGPCDDVLLSQWFCLQDSHPDSVNIFACNDSDAFGLISDGFNFQQRVKMAINRPAYRNLARELYVDTAGNSRLYHAEFEKTRNLKTFPVPEYVADWLALMPGFSSLHIDGVKYRVVSSEVTTDETTTGDTHVVEMELALDGVQLSNTKCSEEDRNCNPPPNWWLWNDGLPIEWNDDENILMNN
jgi:hypothetical protein